MQIRNENIRLLYSKVKHYCLVECLVGLEDYGRIFRMVGAVGIMLALDCDSVVVVIDAALLALGAAVEPVAGVHLHAGLGGGDGERAAAACCLEDGGGLKLAGSVTVYEPAGVVALAIPQGGKIFTDVAPKAFGIYKVHRRTCHRLGLTQRDEGLVCGKIFGGVELQGVTEHRALAVKVEICVIGEVDDGGGVCARGEREGKHVVLAPLIVGNYGETAGIAHLSVCGNILELHCSALLAGLPYAVGKTVGPAVQMIGAIIDRKTVDFAVHFQVAFCDTVGKTAGAFAEARTVVDIAFCLAVTQDNVSKDAVSVGYIDTYYCGAKIGKNDGSA